VCPFCAHLLLHPFCVVLCRITDVHVLSVAAADGGHQDTEHVTAAAPLGDIAVVSGAAVAVLSADQQQLCMLTLAGRSLGALLIERAGTAPVCALCNCSSAVSVWGLLPLSVANGGILACAQSCVEMLPDALPPLIA
jgi:hypothetical protein